MNTNRCPIDGQFYGPETAAKHRICFMIQNERDSGYHWSYGVVQGAGSGRNITSELTRPNT